MQGRFTEKAKASIESAQNAAMELGHNYVGSEHLLLGLLAVEDGIAARALEGQGVTSNDVTEKIEEMTGAQNTGGSMPQDFTPRTKRVLEVSLQEALRMGAGYIGTEHLLLALLRDPETIAVRILLNLSVNIQKLYEDMMNMLGEGDKPSVTVAAMGEKGLRKQKNSNTPTLDKYSRDLTQMAVEQKFDPIVGRDKEIQRVIQILSRRTKNNPCLVGDPGVGKTAIVEGLAQKIVEGNVPETLKDKRVISLDLSAMVAGSKYRGEFEERIKKAIQEVTSSANVILFIDELHTIIGAGGAEGALDASNILKPSLARGEMQVVGATTLNEYRKHVEKDAALERRFQPVTVDEPSEEEAVAMLRGIRDKYEAHHNVSITDKAIEAAVKLSSRYISDRFLPDKAIDLIDEASSKMKLQIYTAPPQVKELESQWAELEKEKEAAIKTEEFEKAGSFKKQQAELKKQLDNAKNDWQTRKTNTTQTVDEEEIADVVSLWTGVPVKKLQQEEGHRLMHMEEAIHQRIVGQDEAVKIISKAIRRGRVGLKNPKRPIGSFLFLGPTGVGKTELSRALAEILFGDENALVRVDMSEYMEKHSISKLIGSPPGYVGYDEGGQLSEKIRRKPYSVILFDEIEKAHPDVFNILLQVLDDGHITDAQGRRVDFKNCVIIMTSNAGARSIVEPKRLGFVSEEDVERSYENMKKMVMDEVKQVFRPEFINRIDDLIVFHPLDKDNVKQITKQMLQETVKRVWENMNINIRVTDDAVNNLAAEGYDPVYGARPLRRVIQSKVEDELAEAILDEKFKEGDQVEVASEEQKIVLKKDAS
ncbi:MAG: ATP-dependent Clp protease ATP-binding subunit [Clostridiales bacterium]|jgi:ATP-dependent Clp protease ATP-binding subunit ClpC|nr:ATP-dependent Clp protease ATP-binding subunit [Clostridiales bacterium]